MSRKLIYATAAYQAFADSYARAEDHPLLSCGVIERRHFPDGERYLKIQADVNERDITLIGGTTDDAATLELFDLANAFVDGGARRLDIVIPYFGYSTMERAVTPGEVVAAKTRARLLSAIPSASYGNHFHLFDVHSEGIPHYFEGVHARHIYGKEFVIQAARQHHFSLHGEQTPLVLAATDAGRAKWVESLARDMGVDAAFVYKRRTSGSDTQVVGVNADVGGRHVVIYDDMVRTGGSLTSAARSYRDAGATHVSAIATHGLFPGDALEKLEASGLFTGITVTNSVPWVVSTRFLSVVDVAPLLRARLEPAPSTG
jgi:ribose-phosphate pyrophosphokinase